MALLTRLDATGPTGASVTFVGAAAGGDTAAGGQSVLLLVNNQSAAAITVTLVTPELVEGALAVADRTVTVPSGLIRAIPVPSRYNDAATGLASFTYSAVTTVSVAVVFGPITPVNTVWITHSGTGASVEVPEAALPMYRQSGWDLLPKRDVAALAKAELDAAAAADAAMAPKTEETTNTEETPPAQGTTPDKETS